MDLRRWGPMWSFIAFPDSNPKPTAEGVSLFNAAAILRDGDGISRLMELEPFEPSLLLGTAPDNGTAFAKVLLSCVLAAG